MKTFKDLEFSDFGIGGKRAFMLFDNGYGISVVRIKLNNIYLTKTESDNEWEIAVLKKTGEDIYELCYDTPITNDVIGYLTEEGVTEIMEKIQNLPNINIGE